MYKLKLLTFALVLALGTVVYTAARVQDDSKSPAAKATTPCCAMSGSSSRKAECCKEGARCCTENAECCKGGMDSCKTSADGKKCCGDGKSCCMAGKDAASAMTGMKMSSDSAGATAKACECCMARGADDKAGAKQSSGADNGCCCANAAFDNDKKAGTVAPG